MYGQAMNHLSDKVFTPREVQPSDDVKVHLDLTGPNAGKSFIDMSVSAANSAYVGIVIIPFILII
jgi:hypothetical protein